MSKTQFGNCYGFRDNDTQVGESARNVKPYGRFLIYLLGT